MPPRAAAPRPGGAEPAKPGDLRATRRTVLAAGGANLLVGLLKLGAGILVGSSAMLAESASRPTRE
jgi:divalent metal cation (Fe/Co/Zn/Cd) transporter